LGRLGVHLGFIWPTWGALWPTLGPLGVHLGPTWPHVEPLGAHLGSLGALGELWEGLYIEKLPINRTSGRYVTFLWEHVLHKRKAAPLYDPELEDAVPIFNFMGACMRMVYMGAGMETAGDLHTFQPCAAVIPNVPSSVPARLRQTYWRRVPKMGTQDVLLASLTEFLFAFVDMHSFAESNDPYVLSRVYDRIHSCSVHAFMHHEPGQMSILLTLHGDPVAPEVAKYFAGASSASGVARPARVEDYNSVAGHIWVLG